jgi:malyl-CoA/(S)-citramalyl-CoA lyase
MKPNRTNLSVPGHRKKMHPKALSSDADVIMFDLEDSVPPEHKETARNTIIDTLEKIESTAKTISVRVNSTDTPFAYRDIIEIVFSCGSIIDRIALPKVNGPGDIYFISRLLDGVEADINLNKTIKVEACIETAQGLSQVNEIAESSERLSALSFGIADYSASVGVGLNSISGHGEKDEAVYPGHRWHFPLSRMVMAAKANNLLAIDAPFGDFKNIKGLTQSAVMSNALGCNGKWVIHPNQIQPVNQVFTPSMKDIDRARKILDLFEDDGPAKNRAVAVDGKMVDQATYRLAKLLVEQAEGMGLLKS